MYIPLYSHIVSDDWSCSGIPKSYSYGLFRHQRPDDSSWHPQATPGGFQKEDPQ